MVETARQTTLMEQPEIIELFRVLEENRLMKEKQEVESLVNYLDGMEIQFGQVMKELGEMRGQLNQIQDAGVRSSAVKITERVENKIQEIGGQLSTVKNNLLHAAKNAVHTFREKGVDALRKTVSAMRISSALSYLKEGMHSGMESVNREAGKISIISGELHVAGEHMKNIGRVLTGKEMREPAPQNPDKGILAKMQKTLLSCGGRLSAMEQRTENTRKRVEQFASKGEKKPSVKAELKRLKNEKGNRSMSSVIQEKTR